MTSAMVSPPSSPMAMIAIHAAITITRLHGFHSSRA